MIENDSFENTAWTVKSSLSSLLIQNFEKVFMNAFGKIGNSCVSSS